MLFNIIPLVFILGALGVVAYIVKKKFPAIVNIDVNNIPQEKERRVKQQILNSRLKRNLNRYFNSVIKFLRPLFRNISEWIKDSYKRLLAMRENYSKDTIKLNGTKDEIDNLFIEAESAEKKEEYEIAEKNYIQIISVDSKNVEAFKKLGQLYLAVGKISEAKDTLEHVLKLTQEDAEVYANLADISKERENLEQSKGYYQKSIELNNANGQNYFNLAEIHKEQGSFKEAMKSMQEALKIEPKSPKYLDGMFEISIIAKDKAEALDAYKKLKAINPENGKLEEMKEKIDAL